MRVSVVVTAYNSETFVKDAVESVLRQTLPVDEVVVVDDGSSDRTGEIVKQFAERGVRYLYQDNQGPGAARNRGVNETSGELIAFLDADDIWLEHKNQKQMEYLFEHPNVALVSGFAWWWNVAKGIRKVSGKLPRNRSALRREILVHNVVGNPSMVILRREALLDVGLFDANVQWGEDWELWIRMIDRYDVALIPEPIIVYRWHLDNISHYRRFERLESFWSVSRNAILKSRPAWLRPFLLVRSWSKISHKRAMYAIEQKNMRWRQLVYAVGAFVAFPWENGNEKFRTLVRSVVGDHFYQGIKRFIRSWLHA
jgi:glycosyltransferase involved in cell wall biosynthesis